MGDLKEGLLLPRQRQAERREDAANISVLRRLGLYQKLEEVNQQIWHGVGRIQDYTSAYIVDRSSGINGFGRRQTTQEVYTGQPLLVLEAGHPEKYTYRKIRYGHIIGFHPVGLIPETAKYKEVTETITEPVCLAISISDSGRNVHIALGRHTQPNVLHGNILPIFDEVGIAALHNSVYSREMKWWGSVDIAVSLPNFKAELDKKLRSLLLLADPTGAYFAQLTKLPPQPSGRRTGPLGIGKMHLDSRRIQ